jgi:hypothetical protein
MSNYTKSTNFATKDNLTPGDPLKVVRGTEIDTEFNNIATAVATKTDNSAAAITGGSITGITDLAVADGGTGASTAAGALNNLLPSQTSNANKYLQTDGTNASWDAVTLSTADITGTLAVANGGTGVTSSTGTGSVVLSNSPTLVTPALGTPSALVGTNITGTASGLTAGNVTTNANLTGAVTSVGNATSLGSFTSSQLAGALTDETGSGSAVFATSPTLVTPILGTPTSATLTNATGLPISTGVSGLGTGIATALAVNTGSAGAPVLFNGALGTPSSGTVTNLTGTASININGTVGATTATTGAFTTLSASGAFSANGGATLGDASGDALTINSSAVSIPNGLNFDSNTLVIDATNNRVGVGTSSPVYPLVVSSASSTQLQILAGNTSDAVLLFGDTDANAIGRVTYAHADNSMRFSANNAEYMRITSAGNVGIGTSSPNYLFSAQANSVQMGFSPQSGIGYLGNYSNVPLAIVVNNAEKARFDTSGNLGLGVTPSAWISSYRTFSVGDSGFISSRIGAGVNNLESGVNWFRNSGGSFVYKANGFATNYGQQDGQHIWYNAPNNTSGASAALTFTQAMTLDASRRLMIDTTSIGIGASGFSLLNVGGAQASSFQSIKASGGEELILGVAAGAAFMGSYSNTALNFRSNNTNQMTLSTAGNLGLGVTPSAWIGKALQIGLYSGFGIDANGNAFMANNAYNDTGSSYRYVASSLGATQYRQAFGVHQWYNAPSGTAGNAITFTQAMTLDASGNLLVGTTAVGMTAGGVRLKNGGGNLGEIALSNNSGSADYVARFLWGSSGTLVGNITVSSTATSYVTSSDYRLKNSVALMTGALAKVAQLKPVTYKWNADGSDGEGFIAHELAEVCPHAVVGEKDAVDEDGNPKYQGIDTSFLVATLTAAIQELKAEFDAYKASHP